MSQLPSHSWAARALAVPGSSLHSIGQLFCQAPAASACTAHMRCPTAWHWPLQGTAALSNVSYAMRLQGPHTSMEEQIEKFSKVIYVGGELHVNVCLGLCVTAPQWVMAEAAGGQDA